MSDTIFTQQGRDTLGKHIENQMIITKMSLFMLAV